VTGNVDGSATPTAIDVANPVVQAADRRALRLVVGIGGDVRMCDPQVAPSDPRGC
jgi:type IV fimbrial biogenesis protein FimT